MEAAANKLKDAMKGLGTFIDHVFYKFVVNVFYQHVNETK